MNRIVESAHKVVAGELKVEEQPWFCLKLVRQVVENAMGWPSGGFHARYWKERVEENRTSTPWARDAERSMRNMGLAVHEVQAGDLVFNYRAAWPYGHVGVMLTDELVLENTPSNRGFKGPGAIRIAHLNEWGTPTTIIRIPEASA